MRITRDSTSRKGLRTYMREDCSVYVLVFVIDIEPKHWHEPRMTFGGVGLMCQRHIWAWGS